MIDKAPRILFCMCSYFCKRYFVIKS
jgi:hypothetical protein